MCHTPACRRRRCSPRSSSLSTACREHRDVAGPLHLWLWLLFSPSFLIVNVLFFFFSPSLRFGCLFWHYDCHRHEHLCCLIEGRRAAHTRRVEKERKCLQSSPEEEDHATARDLANCRRRRHHHPPTTPPPCCSSQAGDKTNTQACQRLSCSVFTVCVSSLSLFFSFVFIFVSLPLVFFAHHIWEKGACCPAASTSQLPLTCLVLRD